MWPNQGSSNPAYPPGYNPAYPPLPPNTGVYPQPPRQQYLPVQYPPGVNPAMLPKAPPVVTSYTGVPGPHPYPVTPTGYPVAPTGYPVAPAGVVQPGVYQCAPKGYHYKGHHYHGGVNPLYPLNRGIGGGLAGLAVGLIAHKAHKKLKKGKKLKKVHKMYKHGYYKVRLTSPQQPVSSYTVCTIDRHMANFDNTIILSRIGSVTYKELQFDSDASKVELGYWYGKVLVKMW
ncbi:splicing factor 3A subunit 2-like isoform X2 [Corythoichthys intestinalis]|nr:splicing factor 3A subunit 2-like isoform X2 [Corythoichthys intestinalis]